MYVVIIVCNELLKIILRTLMKVYSQPVSAEVHNHCYYAL